ncbi:MAG: hypothetical protein ABIO21_26730 [Pseudomonas sp.]
MPSELTLLDNLRIVGKSPGSNSENNWLYDTAKLLHKVNSHVHHTDYVNFFGQVMTACTYMALNPVGKELIMKIRRLRFKVDIIPTVGDGFFIPFCDPTKADYEIPNRPNIGATIVWDPKKEFTHTNTLNNIPVTYPAWVVLAHELGHAIQLNETPASHEDWYKHYQSNMEAVEMDNVRQHETPLVKSLGLLERLKYS